MEKREGQAQSQMEKLRAIKAAKAAKKAQAQAQAQLPVQAPLSPPRRSAGYIVQQADDDWDDFQAKDEDTMQALTFVENGNDMLVAQLHNAFSFLPAACCRGGPRRAWLSPF